MKANAAKPREAILNCTVSAIPWNICKCMLIMIRSIQLLVDYATIPLYTRSVTSRLTFLLRSGLDIYQNCRTRFNKLCIICRVMCSCC